MWRTLASIPPEARSLFEGLERRIRGLHPALHQVRFTNRWMGPICFTNNHKPIITSLAEDRRVLVATGYSGHGVALSARVGQTAGRGVRRAG